MIRRYGKSWGFDYYPNGRSGPRIRRRGFKTRIEAAGALRKLQKGERVSRRLSSLVDLWHKLHGQSLKDAKYRLTRTMAIVERLGNPDIDDFTASDWAEYRAERLNKVTASTVNHEQRYLSAVLAEMVRMGHIPTNPIANVRQIKVAETELTFLSLDQCRQLLEECQASSNPHCYAVALLCLATGARWGEAEKLTWAGLLPGKVLYKGESTKTGKSRAVPIADNVLQQIKEVANPAPGRLFNSCRLQNPPANDPHPSSYLRESLHDEWWGYSLPAANPRSWKHYNDNALLPFKPGPPGFCSRLESCKRSSYYFLRLKYSLGT